MRASDRQWQWGVAGVLALAVLPYLNAVNAFWVGDDYNYIVPKTLPTVINFFNPVGRAAYRPTNWLTWALDYAIFGPHPPGWHLTSIALHVLNTLLVVLLLRELARAWWPADVAAQRGVPLLAGALFAVHPSHPETVTWTGGRADVAFGIGLFLGAWALARWRAGGRRGRGWYALAALGVLLAILGKEAGMVAPLALLLVDRASPDPDPTADRGLGTRVQGLVRTHALFFALAGGYAALRVGLYLTGQGRLMYGTETHLRFSVLTLLDSAAGYLLAGLGAWQAPETIATWAPAVKGAIVVGAVILGAGAIRWGGRPAWFAVLWVPATVLVTYEAAANRWFYVPSLGVCLGAALLIYAVGRARLALRAGLAAALILAWGVITMDVNAHWVAAGEVARGLVAQIRALYPAPARPATFYMANPPYSYQGVLLFNSGFSQAPGYVYQDYVTIRGYELAEHAAQVAAALQDPAQVGPNPIFLRYEGGRLVPYPNLAALVAAQGAGP